MNKTLNLSVLSGIFVTLLMSFQNCSKVEFAGVDAAASLNEGTGDNSNCRVDLVNSTKKIKILFVIDTSGSNATNNGNPGTDMGKVWRLNTINAFLNAYAAKSNFEFGFATFQGVTANPLIKNGSQGVFSNNMSLINQAIDDFKNTPDESNTPYDAALGVAKSMISYDQAVNASKDVGYVVVMISDGSPSTTRYTKNGDAGLDNLATDVKSVTSEAAGQVSMNTVYLYNDSFPGASQTKYLETISSVGAGSFIRASAQQSLQISDTIQVPQTICN